MKIKTDQCLMNDRAKITQIISEFWDNTSEGWLKVWGPHIHHGYYENNHTGTPEQAQEKTMDKLAHMVGIKANDDVLDVGCGMGGTSLYLAKKYRANVTGITISPKQVEIATSRAESNEVKNVNFRVEDALSLKCFANDSFDVIWSLESCEQFYDKSLFLQQAFRVLRPGGKLMLATWCSDRDEFEGKLAKKYQNLCEVFSLPYMPTIEYYRALLEIRGFVVDKKQDWSIYVMKSWDEGMQKITAKGFFEILRIGGWQGWRFAKKIKLMRDAFYDQTVRYGVFIATKPL